MKLGKLPARPGAVTFKLSNYGVALPAAPASDPNYKNISDWQGVMGNDTLGDCVCAEAGHGTIFYNNVAGNHVAITTADVVALYSAVTGYDPKQTDPSTGDNPTDQGTDMPTAASYRRKTGLKDANGKYHKIAAYLDLGVANEDNLKKAIHYFKGAGVGFNFPSSAMDQFNAGKPWTVVKGATIEGGHDVFACGYDKDYIYCVSWPTPDHPIQKMSWAFFKKYADESLVYLSTEMLKAGKSPEGFNVTQLEADLKAL